MRRYNDNNIVSRIILILLTVIITFALAAPVLQAQEKHQAWPDSDAVHKVTGDSDPDVTTVLGKRTLGDDVNQLWDGWWHFLNVLGKPASSPPIGPLPSVAAAAGAEHYAGVPVPPLTPNLNPAEAQHVPDVYDVSPKLSQGSPAQDLNTLWDGRWHFLNVLGKPEPPPPPRTPVTPPPSIGSHTDSGSDSDNLKPSTMISNARRAESQPQSENLYFF